MKMVIQTFLYIRARPSLPNFSRSLHSKARVVLERFVRELMLYYLQENAVCIDVIIADTRREEDTLTNEVGIFGTSVANGFL